MIRFKIDFWGLKAGDPVPEHKIDELKLIAPEVIYDDGELESKSESSPQKKTVEKSPSKKGL